MVFSSAFRLIPDRHMNLHRVITSWGWHRLTVLFTEDFYSKGKLSNTQGSHSSLWILKSHKTVAEKSSGSRARPTHRDSSKASHRTLSVGGEDADLPHSRSPKSPVMDLRLRSVKEPLPSKWNHYARPLQELIQYFMRTIFCLPINISSNSILCN